MSSVKVFKTIECPKCSYIHWIGNNHISKEKVLQIADEIKSGERIDELMDVDLGYWYIYMTCDRCN